MSNQTITMSLKEKKVLESKAIQFQAFIANNKSKRYSKFIYILSGLGHDENI